MTPHADPRIGAVVGNILTVPPGADAELEPSTRQMIDRRDLLRGDDRVPFNDQADPAADAQPAGLRSGRGEGDEEVVGVPVLARQLSAAVAGRGLPPRRDVLM